MIYKVGLLGASGRMGLEVAALLREGFKKGADLFELCDVVTDSDKYSNIEGVDTRSLEEPPREPVHVWIDFSQPDATVSLLAQIDTPVVIATTGFTSSQLKRVEDYAKKRPVLLSSNTSLGMNLMFDLISQLPSDLPFDARLHEEHHVHKKDAPSGTAKTLLEKLAEAGFKEVPTTVVRAGGTRGIHTLRLVGENEVLEIRHEALDRKIFAQGALLAAAFLVKQQEPGMYSMKNVLGEKR